jgi:hypothetical protein
LKYLNDTMAMELTKHMAAGVSVDYHVATQAAPNNTKGTADNEVAVREVELWPLVGAFMGNYSVWSEIDASPNVAVSRNTATAPGADTPAGGGVNLSQADLRYVYGNQDSFLNFRIGMIAPEGYGASDQWIDDGSLPSFDALTPNYNQDTLATPLGAMNTPQLGAEIGWNYKLSTFLTAGVYNGYDGANGSYSNVQSTVTPAMHRQGRDFKFQVDELAGPVAITGAYYNGRIELLEPSNVNIWTNHYQQGRLYLTGFVVPAELDLFSGLALGRYEYVNSGSVIKAGNFNTRGAFFGANYYVLPKLTLAGHVDFFQHAYAVTTDKAAHPQNRAFTFIASVPFEHSLFNLHWIRNNGDVAGKTDDWRIEWRFLF